MNKNYDYAGIAVFNTPTKWRMADHPSPAVKVSKPLGLWVAFLTAFILMCIGQQAWAQNTANYTFSSGASGSLGIDMNGNAIDMSSATTQLVAPGLDASASSVTNIGFDFYLMGNRFTQFSVQDDGLMQLGSSTVGTNVYTLTGGTVTSPRLSAFNADMRTGLGNGKIHSKVIGTAPNRVLVVEFLNMQVFYTTAAAGTSTWQMRLYEKGNIEYVYGNMSISSGSKAPSIGFFTGAVTGSFASIAYSTHQVSTTAPYAANPLTAAVGPIAELTSAADGSRRYYRFAPPGTPQHASINSIAAPSALTFTAMASASITANWTASAPETGILKYLVSYSTDDVTYTVAGSTLAGTTTYTINGLVPSTLYYIRVVAVSEGSASDAATGNISTTAPGNYISTASGNWSAPGTWTGGAVPSQYDNAIIADGHSVTIDIAGLSIADLSIGTGTSGLLNFGSTPTSFTVKGNLTVQQGGSLDVYNGTTGKNLLVGGNITNSGTINLSVGTGSTALTLNGTSVQTVGGSGVFTGNLIRGLTFNNTSAGNANVIWNLNNISVGGTLTFTAGKVQLGANKLTLGTAITSAGTLSYSAGGFLNGTFNRFWTATGTGSTVSAGVDPSATAGRYPFITPTGQQRSAFVERSGAPAGGQLSVTYVNASTTTPVSIADNVYNIERRYNGNWTFSSEGSGIAATTWEVALMGAGAFSGSLPANGNARVLYAAAASGGTHQNGSVLPTAQRVFTLDDLTAAPLYIGMNNADLLSTATSVASGNWSDAAIWDTGIAPSCADMVVISSGHTIIMDSAGNSSKNVTVAAGATLNIVSGDLSIGCVNKNTPLLVNGTLSVSGGALNVNGNINLSSASAFAQTGGTIIIDGNNAGDAATSVAASTPLLNIATTNISLTAGTLMFVDPHTAATAATGYTLYFTNGTAVASSLAATSAHTTHFGNGTSTDAGGHTGGFNINNWVSSAYLTLGSVVINAGSGTNRLVTSTYTLALAGDLEIMGGSTLSLGAGATLIIGGDLTVDTNGTLLHLGGVSTGIISANTASNLTSIPATAAQAFTNNGTIANAVESTGNFNELTINNSSVGGLTLNAPFSVTGTLTLTQGKVNTSAGNILRLGSTTAGATLVGGSATSYINGPFIRTIGNANTANILFPIGKAQYAPISLAPTTTSVSAFKAETFDSNTGSANASITNLSDDRRWEALLLSGSFSDINVTLTDANLLPVSIPVQAASAAGQYTSTFGSFANYVPAGPSVSSSTPVEFADYTGFLSFAESNICSGTPAPGSTVASSSSICFGNAVSLSLENNTIGTGVTYVWESSSDNVTFSPIAGAESSTLTITPSDATYYRAVVTCGLNSGTSTAVLVDFNNTITGTTPGSRCGIGTVELAAVAADGASIEWFDAEMGGTSVGAGPNFVTPVIETSTTYFAQAQTYIQGNAALGAGLASSNVAGQSFLPGGWGGAKTQYIIRASELDAAGIGAGNITSLGFEPTTAGQTYQGFTVMIGHTENTTAPTSTFISENLSQVYTGPLADNGFLPVANVVNTLNFGTGAGSNASFNWNGTSNIVVSISWSRMPLATTSTASTMKVDNVGFASTAVRQRDSRTPAEMLAETAITASTTSFRPRFLINGQVVCGSSRVPVLATVTTPPALTLSDAPVAFCSGSSSSIVTITAGAADYDLYSWSPAENVTGSPEAGWTFSPLNSTTYTLTATNSVSGCATNVDMAITVNETPMPLTVDGDAVMCLGTIQQLSVIGGTFASPIIGTQALTTVGNSTSSTLGPNPLQTYYGGTKQQWIYTADELAAIGLSSGSPISAIKLDMGSEGSTQMDNMVIKMKNSSTTAFANVNSWESGMVVVKTAFSHTATVGWNSFALTSPFTWDGTSNLVVEMNYSNNNGGGTGTNTARYSTTPFSSTIFYRVDSSPAAAVDAYIGAATNIYNSRNNVEFVFRDGPVITWSPATGLYTDEAATIPYVIGASANSVYAMPSETITYSATATTSAACSVSGSLEITVNSAEAPALAGGSAGVSNLIISEYGEGAGGNKKYIELYNGTGESVDLANYRLLRSSNGGGWVATPLVLSGTLANNTAYSIANNSTDVIGADMYTTFLQFNGDDAIGLEWNGGDGAVFTLIDVVGQHDIDPGSGWAVAGSANATVDRILTRKETVCAPNTDWASSAGTDMANSEWIVSLAVYNDTAMTTDLGSHTAACGGAGNNEVTVCEASTVAQLESAVTGTEIKWYAAQTGGTELLSSATLVAGSYYASQTENGCESLRTEIVVFIAPTLTPDFAAIAPFCAGSTAPVLPLTSPNGVTGTWDPAVVSNSANGTYIFTPDAGQCAAGQTLEVIVTPTVVPDFASIATFCSGSEAPVLETTSPNGVVGTWNPATISNTANGTYVFTPDAGQCATMQTLDVTVTQLISSDFAAIPAFCSGSTAPTLATTSPNGVTGTWNPATISNTENGSYVFTPDAGQCATGQTLEVTVTPTVTPDFAAIPALCQGSSAPVLSSTSPNGVAGTWSPAIISTVTPGTTNYTFTPGADCSAPIVMAVTINATPDAPTGNAVQDFNTGDTVSDLVVSGTGTVTWYIDAAGQTVADPFTELVTGDNYFASFTVNGCESALFEVTVGINLGVDGHDLAKLSFYPNPVSDMLTIDYAAGIDGVDIFNMVGQNVQSVSTQGTQVKIDMTNLAAGTYIVKVVAGSTVKNIKIVKR